MSSQCKGWWTIYVISSTTEAITDKFHQLIIYYTLNWENSIFFSTKSRIMMRNPVYQPPPWFEERVGSETPPGEGRVVVTLHTCYSHSHVLTLGMFLFLFATLNSDLGQLATARSGCRISLLLLNSYCLQKIYKTKTLCRTVAAKPGHTWA
jgi:hypothetical protein